MHPAFSVLFFTVTSGFGYGLMLCLILAQQFGFVPLTLDDFILGSVVAFVLFSAGLLSSTFHLANPKNAWRSFARFKTSWLSREGVLAILAYPLLMSYVALVYLGHSSFWISVLAAVNAVLIVLLLFCTAMIYASLKTIPQWNKRSVPLIFISFGITSGLLSLGLLVEWLSDTLVYLSLIGLTVSGGLKWWYFKSLGEPSKSSINTATSFSQAKVTLFDAGHSNKNFLQKEFVYQVGPKTTRLARTTSLLLMFVIPATMLGAIAFQTPWPNISIAAWLMVISLYLGLLLERWLFFIEAKHVVRHYYGEE